MKSEKEAGVFVFFVCILHNLKMLKTFFKDDRKKLCKVPIYFKGYNYSYRQVGL